MATTRSISKEAEPTGSAYDEIKYSRYTQTLANFYPSWTQIRKNKESIGQQFLNVFGLEFEDVDNFLGEALNNQFIGTANLGEVYQLYKFPIPHYWDNEIKVHNVTAHIGEYEAYSLEESIYLREFYSSNDRIILDFDKHVGYVRSTSDRRRYTKIEVFTNLDDYHVLEDQISLHHVWNVFDEFALLLGLQRRLIGRGYDSRVETNEELRARILNVFKFPANSQKMGLINGIGRSLGLINSVEWNEDTEVVTIADNKAHKDTIIVNNEKPLPGQLSNGSPITLSSIVDMFPPTNDSGEFNNTTVIESKIELYQGAKRGTYTTPVFSPSNLKTWTSVIVDSYGSIKADVLSYDNELIVSGADFIEIPEELDVPIKLKIYLSRDSIKSQTPTVSGIVAHYKNSKSTIEYIHSIEIDALHNDEFRKTLHEPSGEPKEELKNYVQELHEVAPIFWDKFKWDEAYWDVVEENLMGLEVLPHKWDPNLGEKASSYLQTGIGFGNDLLVKLDKKSWGLQIHNGYYYIGKEAEEHYLFSKPVTNLAENSDIVLLDSFPKQGSPVVVLADGKYLTQVSLLDEDFNYSIYNSETILPESDGSYYLSYNNAVIKETTLSSSYSVSDNVVIPDIKTSEEATFIYSVKDSFVLDGNKVILSEMYNEIKVVYEEQDDTAFYSAEDILLDPMISHYNTGFLYLSDRIESPEKLIVTSSPNILNANGVDVALVIVDVLDKHNNPVLNTKVTAYSVSVGEVSEPETYGNRHMFRYTAPDIDGDATIKIKIDGSDIETSTIIKVR